MKGGQVGSSLHLLVEHLGGHTFAFSDPTNSISEILKVHFSELASYISQISSYVIV